MCDLLRVDAIQPCCSLCTPESPKWLISTTRGLWDLSRRLINEHLLNYYYYYYYLSCNIPGGWWRGRLSKTFGDNWSTPMSPAWGAQLEEHALHHLNQKSSVRPLTSCHREVVWPGWGLSHQCCLSILIVLFFCFLFCLLILGITSSLPNNIHRWSATNHVFGIVV